MVLRVLPGLYGSMLWYLWLLGRESGCVKVGLGIVIGGGEVGDFRNISKFCALPVTLGEMFVFSESISSSGK